MSNTKDSAVEVTLGECEPGLFWFGETLGFKSEYKTKNSSGIYQSDAYCVESGEYFWGGAKGAVAREALLVRPIASMPAATEGEDSGLLTRAIGDITAALILADKADKVAAWTAPYVEAVNRLDAHPATTDQDKLIADLTQAAAALLDRCCHFMSGALRVSGTPQYRNLRAALARAQGGDA